MNALPISQLFMPIDLADLGYYLTTPGVAWTVG